MGRKVGSKVGIGVGRGCVGIGVGFGQISSSIVEQFGALASHKKVDMAPQQETRVEMGQATHDDASLRFAGYVKGQPTQFKDDPVPV